MTEIEVEAKKWGNSIGIILPKEIVRQEGILQGAKIHVIVKAKKPMTVGELMKLAKKHPLPKLKQSTAEIMREIDAELWPR